jgi:hypothetical protein
MEKKSDLVLRPAASLGSLCSKALTFTFAVRGSLILMLPLFQIILNDGFSQHKLYKAPLIFL